MLYSPDAIGFSNTLIVPVFIRFQFLMLQFFSLSFSLLFSLYFLPLGFLFSQNSLSFSLLFGFYSLPLGFLFSLNYLSFGFFFFCLFSEPFLFSMMFFFNSDTFLLSLSLLLFFYPLLLSKLFSSFSFFLLSLESFTLSCSFSLSPQSLLLSSLLFNHPLSLSFLNFLQLFLLKAALLCVSLSFQTLAFLVISVETDFRCFFLGTVARLAQGM